MKAQIAFWTTALLVCSIARGIGATLYVSLTVANPVPPYGTWNTAATNIQDAIDAAANGDSILVTNGVYEVGGRTVNGYALTNRVVIDKAVTVQSVNGPMATVIEGFQVPGTTNGSSAVRCVYMTNNAALIGFTLRNGATMLDQGSDSLYESCGGGVWCESTNSVISNCVLCANTAEFTYDVGGGAVSGTLLNCVLAGNVAGAGGGAYESVLDNCVLSNNLATATIGGGAYNSTLDDCLLVGNSAPSGGGAADGVLNDCVVTNNIAGESGGGVFFAALNGCLILGNSAASGGGSYDCAITNSSLENNTAQLGGGSYSGSLNACILSNNAAINSGGGTYSSSLTDCEVADNSAMSGGGADLGNLYNCLVSGNVATGAGGGINSADAYNSALTGNFAVTLGGGAAGSTLASCTLTGNSASSGGGVYSSVLTNCIVYYNAGVVGTNYDAGSSLNYCCATPLPTGLKNISADPRLANAFRLSSDSPCLGAGNGADVTGVDIDGDPWATPPAIGCDEFYANAATGQLSVAVEAAFTNLATAFAGGFTAQIRGHVAMSYWDFGDGTRITNQPYASHAWAMPGDYPVSLRAFNQSNPAGVSAAITVHVASQPTQYVSLASANPVAPYLSWATAATSIQDAVDTAYGGGTILVSNGVYQTGGRLAVGTLTNRLVVLRPTIVQSVNGPAVTAIDGYQIPGSANGLSAVRGVYLGDGAQLIGFTITGGATTEYYDNYYDEIDAEGGGIWCQSTNVLVSDCIVESNSCTFAGAGIYSGTAIGCQIVDNANRSSGSFSGGGGAAFSVLLDDQVNSNSIGGDGFGGAGAFSCILSNCVIDGNSNGAVLSCSLENCTIEGNTHSFYAGAGGASLSTLSNCFICYNQGSEGGGAYDCTLNSCVISNNLASLEGGGVYYDSHQTNAPGVQNIIIGNVAANGGGVYFIGIITNLSNWTFISNSAAGSGGGLFLASDATLENCAFTGNSCGVNGGGVCGSQSYPLASVSNCVFIANIASWFGGGAYETALTDCYVVGNRATNGGGVYGIVNNCVLNDNSAAADGGGLFYDSESVAVQEVSNCAFTNNSALNGGGAYAANYYTFFSNCVFQANSAINDGGGIDGATLGYCVLSGNTANDGGGGSDVSLFNCLLDGNSAIYGGGAFYNGAYLAEGSTIVGNNAQNAGGGLYSTGSIGMTNCIIYDNSAPNEANYTLGFYLANFCCSEPLLVAPFGQPNSNITNAPSFVNAAAGDYHLSSKSPLINSGNNASIAGAVDLDGNPRIVGGTVDIGAYEYQTPVSKISYAWLDQYGLPIIAGIDTSNLDGTGLDIYQDWIAGLNPTNVLSILAMLPLAPTNNAGGLVVSWKSVAGRTYFVQCSTNLAAQPAFSTIETGINGSRTGTSSFTDTSATNPGQYFFRVGVEK